MKLDRIATFVAAITIVGFAHSLAAQEKLDLNQTDNVSPSVAAEQELVVQPGLDETNTSVQVMVQTEDRFLSEMKVYPSF